MTEGKAYKVGYGRPPAQHRFQPGQSGNPQGRRKKKLNEAEIVAKVRDELITITINGKTVRIGAFEAAVRKTHMTVLARGSVRDLEKLFQLYARYGAEPEALRNAEMKEASEKVLETIANIFQKTRVSRRHEIVHAEESRDVVVDNHLPRDAEGLA
jgi:hypothetical protein